MKDAQEYINALRQGDYNQASQFIDFVNLKYSSMLDNNRQLGNDDLTPLAIYELSTTDINKEDIEKINFFYNYLFLRNINASGKTMFGVTALIAASPIALMIKDKNIKMIEDGDENIIALTKISDGDKLKTFLQTDDSDPFRALEGICVREPNIYQEDAGKFLKEQDLLAICKNMERQHYLKFIDSAKSIFQQENTKPTCPTLLAHIIIQTFNDYERHLHNKVRNEDLDSGNPKSKKLHIRYDMLNNFISKYPNSANIKDYAKFESDARETLITCLNNKPDWSERTFLQKLTDVLSLGFKAVYRSYFKQEDQFTDELEHNYGVTPNPRLGG